MKYGTHGDLVNEQSTSRLTCKFRDKAQRPSDARFTTLSTAEVFGELRAQLNLTEKPKRKETIPKVMDLPEICNANVLSYPKV